MRAWLIGLVVVVLSAPAFAGPRVIQVANGDVRAFMAAVCESNRSPARQHEIVLAFDGRYEFEHRGPPLAAPAGKLHQIAGGCHALGGPTLGEPTVIEGRLHIRGRGAELNGYGVRVLTGATLTVEDVDFDLGGFDRLQAVHNLGQTTLERVSISNGRVTVLALPAGPSLAEIRGLAINNEGQARLINVGLHGLTAGYLFPNLFDLPPPACIPGAVAVYNSGVLEMTHVTSSGNHLFDNLAECLVEDIFSTPKGRVRLRNSAFLSEVALTTGCVGPVESLGHNYFGRARCAQSLAATDLVGPGPFFDHRPRVSGYRPAVLLPEGHPAVNAVPFAQCAALDQRAFPRLINADRCDIGATERGAPPAANPGTVTGLWYQPEADGHYLQLSFVRPDEVLLTWQTFDADGANVWFYGLGEAGGHRLDMRLYQNVGPIAAGGRIQGGAAAAEVGQATFSLVSCAEAVFEFDSQLPGLAAGRLDFQRLALTEGITCDDGRGQDL